MKAAVVKETAPGERRVALVPEGIGKLTAAGIEVLIERGAGDSAWFSDAAYAQTGATVVDAEDLYEQADVILTVGKPDPARLHTGQAVIGMFAPLTPARYSI